MPTFRDKSKARSLLHNVLKLNSDSQTLLSYTHAFCHQGIRTGDNEVFVVDGHTRQRLIAEHYSSNEVLKPYIRARHIRNWHIDSPDLWIIYLPYLFPYHAKRLHDKIRTKSDYTLQIRYPAIYNYLKNVQRESNTNYHVGNMDSMNDKWRSETSRFEQPKILVSRIAKEPTFAYDQLGYYNDDSTFSITGTGFFGLSILNSRFSKWYFSQMCSTLQGSLRISPADIAQLPLYTPSPQQQHCCTWLAESLVFLSQLDIKIMHGAPSLDLMIAYFEQWLNGLVYEIFFSAEMREHHIYISEQSLKLGLNNLSQFSSEQKSRYLFDVFMETYYINHPLRAMLFNLSASHIVRLIEGEQ